MSEWQEYLVEGDDLRVVVYDHDDVDRIALARDADGRLRSFKDEEQWAKAAEWYMCDVLRPYINHRKTYEPWIDAAIKLGRYGTFSREETYQSAVQVLHDWNVTAERFDEEEKAIWRRLGPDPVSNDSESV